HADLASVRLAVFPGHDAVDGARAAGGHEDAGEHFDGGRLARAVRSDVADDLSGVDVKGDVADRIFGLETAREEIGDRAERAVFAFGRFELLREPVGADDHRMPPVRRRRYRRIFIGADLSGRRLSGVVSCSADLYC